MSYRDWIVSKLNDTKEQMEIDSVTALGECLIEIQTEEGKTVIVGVIESVKVTDHEVHKVYVSGPPTPNIVIAKSGAIWSGTAINYSLEQKIGWGGMGEISSTFLTDDYAGIQKREYKFVEEGLLRHTRVRRLERIYDRIFKVYRTGGLPPVTITLIDSYELSGDEVRNAIAKYGSFDLILKTNPNGNPTGKAYSVAAEIGADIFVWGELLGRLNRR